MTDSTIFDPASAEQILELLDKSALQENMMLYCRGMDRKDLATMQSTFWPEATDNHGAYVGPAHRFCEWACENQKKGRHRSHHYITNILTELRGNVARRESAVIFAMVLPDENRTDLMGGRYRDPCEKRGGEWKVLRRTMIFDFAHQLSPIADYGSVFGGIPADSAFGDLSPEDPIYDAEW